MINCKYSETCRYNSGSLTCKDDSLAREYCGVYKVREANKKTEIRKGKSIETTTQSDSWRGLPN
jgi:hypothetical protein